jgi:hypothetical protein
MGACEGNDRLRAVSFHVKHSQLGEAFDVR